MPQGTSNLRSANFPVSVHGTSSSNGSRNSAKGRRRRAAEEQRRVEQETWNDLNEGRGDEIENHMMSRVVNSPSRRRSRRAQRRSLVYDDGVEDYVPSRHSPTARLTYSDETDLEMALAISLSLSVGNNDAPLSGTDSMIGGSDMDMSYENLVMLENVTCVFPKEVVDSLPVTKFCEDCDSEIVCTICQVEFVEGDSVMNLNCMHSFHNECAREWFLNYSKKCPICKCEIVER